MTQTFKTARDKLLAMLLKMQPERCRLVEEAMGWLTTSFRVMGLHKVFGLPIGTGAVDPHFSHMDEARVRLRLNLIAEEFFELLDATGFKLVDQETGQQIRYGDIVLMAGKHEQRNLVETLDALADLDYVVAGFGVEINHDLYVRIQTEVHAANLTKLGADGNPILRSDGKFLKGPEYMEPQIAALVEKHNLFESDRASLAPGTKGESME